MKPQKQLLRHNPASGIHGDCYRTAIAIALDMDARNVPHFMDGGVSGEEAARCAEAWLNARGLTQISILFDGSQPLQKVLDHIAAVNQRSRPVFLLSGTSRNGTGHVVVCCNGDIVCDPALDNSGIVGPCTDGYWWVTFFGALVATDSVAKRKGDATSRRDDLDRAAAKLSADLIAGGMKRGGFYITIGDGELHVYTKAEVLRGASHEDRVITCDYPIEWHVGLVGVPPLGVSEMVETGRVAEGTVS